MAIYSITMLWLVNMIAVVIEMIKQRHAPTILMLTQCKEGYCLLENMFCYCAHSFSHTVIGLILNDVAYYVLQYLLIGFIVLLIG